jgi:hypothetical protein
LARRSWRGAAVALAAVIASLAAFAGPAQADDQPIALSTIPVNATVGTPFTGAVGTFTVSDPLLDLSQYVASISWGDNDGSVATISMEPSGAFLVSGTHTYSRTGTFNTTVLVDNVSGPNAVAHGLATVTAAPPAPAVSGISPTSGPEAGGTSVTITGTDFTGATDVEFGSTPASDFTFVSSTQITATAPAGNGIRDVTVTTPSGTSAISRADLYTYVPGPAPAPAVTGISPTSGPEAGGASVTITGTDFTGATDVKFGSAPATSFSFVSSTQLTATAPAGTGSVHVKVTTPNGTSTTSNADQYTYIAPRAIQQTASPTVVTGPPTVASSTAGLAGSVNPQGLNTTAHFEYGLDSRYTKPGTSGPVYDLSTADEPVGTDFSAHSVLASVTGLVPNALYHARLVATNFDGTTFGPDVVFTTPADPPPAPPALGASFNVAPVSGLVTIKLHGSFVPLTEERTIPAGTIINTLKGTLKLITATGNKHKNQNGTFGGAVFKVTQFGSGKNKGLTTLALVEGGVKGGPSYASCTTKSTKQAAIAALSKKTLQLLHGSDNHAKFRTKGRYSAATIRGTVWTIADRCDGTFVHVTRGVVDVSDFVRHITVVVRAGHSYLALAKPKKHK